MPARSNRCRFAVVSNQFSLYRHSDDDDGGGGGDGGSGGGGGDDDDNDGDDNDDDNDGFISCHLQYVIYPALA